MSTAENKSKHTNRLSRETSPYLLQHQHNPVDWYSWGPEAFAAARAQNRPIFLSVGYSTCYWCHVMERQCFENEAIATEMNARFINIKVDREERPDVDQLYMTAVQVLTRQGGWPMSVFLTPDLRPFYGGTYFPPEDMYGRPGFPTLLKALDDAYKNRQPDIEKTATQLVEILSQLAEPTAPDAPVTIDEALIDTLIERSVGDYDPQFGGFGRAPKFPRQTLIELLLVYLAGDDESSAADPRRNQIRQMVFHTLDALAAGGIRDQLGGGFHRYSTDQQWLVPHFEIMLYDNAMLGWCYVEAFRQTEDAHYASTARGIFDFVLREMTAPTGAFYTAFDAEVDAQEGLTYLWTKSEIEQLLGKEDAHIFNRVYGVDGGPNFADPHHGTGKPDKSILYLPRAIESVATQMKIEEAEFVTRLEQMRQTLYAARRQRKQPLLDTKILTSWNAMMIRAMAYGGKVLQEPRYLEAAGRAAEFLLKHHRDAEGALRRTSGGVVSSAGDSPETESRLPIPGFLDDYAFFIQALLQLHDASGLDRWRDAALELRAHMMNKFADAEHGGFYFTASDATDLIVRQKTATDSPLPSGNAVAAMVLLALGDAEDARQTLAVFANNLATNGDGMSSMVQAALAFLRHHDAFSVSPSTSAQREAAAGDRPMSPQQVAAGVVSITVSWESPTELHLHLNVLDGFHINAHEAADPLIATSIHLPQDTSANVEYPPGEEQSFAFVTAPIRVYGGDVTAIVRFKSAPSDTKPVRLALTYQACNDNACLPPITKQVEIPLNR